MRAVIDTNILIQAVSSRGKAGFIFDLLFENKFTLCLTTEIILEYEEMLRKFYTDVATEEILDVFRVLPNILHVEVYFDLGLIAADQDDNKFVNCAFASNANCIVSDDKHFKVLQQIPFPKLNVFNVAEFKSIIS